MANLLSTSVTGTLNVSSTVTAPTFVGALPGNASTATSATTATNLGADYTADDWFRATGDNNQVKFYGNSRSIIYRTDGVTNEHGGGGYPHIWYYGGSADGNRVMIINTSGQLWMGNYGWLHDYFAPISHTHSYLPLSGGDLTGSVSVPNGSAVYFNGTGDTNWRIGRNIVTETGNFLTSNTIQFIAPNASGQGWQFVSSDNKTILEFGAYTVNYDGLRYSQGPLWLSDTARLHPIRKRLTAGTSPNNVKIADTSLAAYSANGNPNTYIIIRTAVPQDDYQMGGFTIDLFARYGDTNGKTTIDLGGYWNPESNSGFVGWEAHGSNPQLKPTIQVARETTSGFTCFILSGINWDYPVVVARDLYLGYNSAEGASYGHNWLIYSAANTNDHTNFDTVVWRNAYSDSNPSGFTTNTGTVTSVSGTGSYGGLSLSGTVTSSGSITLGGTPTGTWPISVSGNAATATSATSATSAATWTTARTITIGSTGKSVNGGGNVSWTLAEIGAQPAGNYAASSHNHTIGDVPDIYRLFNNMGDNHSARTSFDAQNTTSSMGFGWRFVQGGTNGPGVGNTGNGQYYALYVGLGNDYGPTQYGMQIAIPRASTNPYLSLRFNEGSLFGAWQKISAAYADTAGSANSVAWGNVTGKPGTFTPSTHTHELEDVNLLVEVLGEIDTLLSGKVTTTYNSSLNSDSRNSRGVTRLYRNDSDSDYSIQTYWTGSRWYIKGYNGDTFHAEAQVYYADNAGTAGQVAINYSNDSNSTYQMLWGSGNSVYGTGGIYCNPNSDIIYAAAFYDANNTGYYLDPNSYSNLYTARAYEWQLHAGAGYGVRFWGGSSSYSIQMSEVGNGTWGGRVAGETTSDYNMYFTMTGGTNRGFVFRNSLSSGGVVAGIDAGGNFRCIGDVIIFASSDARLKKNVKPIENALDKVMQINGVEFDWDEAAQDVHKGHDVGVIAQEIEAVLPELVQTRDNGYKAVKYEKLTALLIETVKELKAEIDELKAQLNK